MKSDQSLAPGDRVAVFPNNPQASEVSGFVIGIRDDGFDVKLDEPVSTPNAYWRSGANVPVLWANVARIERVPTEPAVRELWKLTKSWTLPLLVRTYESNP